MVRSIKEEIITWFPWCLEIPFTEVGHPMGMTHLGGDNKFIFGQVEWEVIVPCLDRDA